MANDRNSQIWLVSECPLDNRYLHTLKFQDRASQLAYFNSKVFSSIIDHTYLRKNWNIRVNFPYDTLVNNNVNYLYFYNGEDNGGKIYFYFIVSKEYISPNVTLLNLELDVMQTYQFDMQLLPCFVEREHTDNSLYSMQMEEGLELGDYVTCGTLDFSGLNNYALIMLSTIHPGQTTGDNTVLASGAYLNGVFSGIGIYAVEQDHYEQLNTVLRNLDSWGKSDGILAMWMYPKGLIGLQYGYEWGDSNVFKPLSAVQTYTVQCPKEGPEGTTYFQGYQPKNLKMYTFPYSLIYVSNNQGQSAVYQPEYFQEDSNGLITFGVIGSYGIDSAVKMYPFHYKGEVENFEEGLTIDNFPMCAWAQDSFKIWYAQNYNRIWAETDILHTRLRYNEGAQRTSMMFGNVIRSITQAFAGLAGGAATGAGIGAAFGGGGAVPGALIGGLIGGIGGTVSSNNTNNNEIISNSLAREEIMGSIRSQIARISDAQVQPPQSKGQYGSTSLNVGKGKKTYSVKWKSVDYQHAKAIDDFFTMYGYKVAAVKTPAITGRPYFNYVKTVGSAVTGVEIEDARKIESILDAGITFWHNPDHYRDYTVDNGGLTRG